MLVSVRYSALLHNMAVIHTKAIRSYNMSQIKATNTKPEMLVRKFLKAQRFGYTPDDLIPPKESFGPTLLHGVEKGERNVSLVNPILFYRNIKPSSLYMVASGMDNPAANILWCQKQEPNGGQIK